MIKEDVYEPDWQTPERREYTKQVADLLADLAPDGVNPSIQSAPLGFKPKVTGDHVVEEYTTNVIDVVAHLVGLTKKTGKIVTLGLEPEPRCYLETTDETITYFKNHLFSGRPRSGWRSSPASTRPTRPRPMREHIGHRLRHRSPVGRLRGHPGRPADAGGGRRPDLQAAGSRAAVDPGRDEEAVDALETFAETIYLSADLTERRDGELTRFLNLGRRDRGVAGEPGRRKRVADALPRAGVPRRDRRVPHHPHELEAALDMHTKTPLSDHLEIETYTWDVLPDQLKTGDITEYVSREIEWVKGQLT